MGSFYGNFDFYGKNCSFYGNISIDDKPHTITNLTYKTYDGVKIIKVVVCVDGKLQEASPTIPDRQSTAQYNYTPVGWSTSPNSEAATSGATSNVTEDRTVFAAYSKTVRTYTATFVRGSDDGGGTLYTCNVEYGQTPVYAGETPTSTRTGYTFSEWSPAISATTEDTTYTAVFEQEQVEPTNEWDAVIASVNNGTYKTKYNIGDLIPLDLGTEGTVDMQIVAFDSDDLASGGKAPITFISKQLLKTDHRMNPAKESGTIGTGSLGGWEHTEMRAYLKDTIKPLIPSNVRSAIKEVNKYSRIYDVSETVQNNVVTIDDVWIPSIKEVGVPIDAETSGPTYSVFSDNASRIKMKTGASVGSYWFLRSAKTSTSFGDVVATGGFGKYGAAGDLMVALGFCI